MSTSRLLRVLVLGAEPSDGPPIRLEEELARLLTVKGVKVFPIRHTRFSDISERIAEVRPHIVQLSAHGAQGGILVLENGAKHEIVPPKAVELLCSREAMQHHVRGVLVNACHSLSLAEELAKYFDFAVGMPDKIANLAAAGFPAAFYAAMARDEHLHDAFKDAEAAFSLKQQNDRPLLRVAAGIAERGYRLQLNPTEKPRLYIHTSSHPADQRLLNELRVHLKWLSPVLEIWDESKISSQPHDEAITQHLERADITLILLSADTMAAKHWLAIQRRAYMRQRAKRTRLFLVQLRPALYDSSWFGGVQPILGAPQPLSMRSPLVRQKVWVELTQMLAGEAAAVQRLLDEEHRQNQEFEAVLTNTPP